MGEGVRVGEGVWVGGRMENVEILKLGERCKKGKDLQHGTPDVAGERNFG